MVAVLDDQTATDDTPIEGRWSGKTTIDVDASTELERRDQIQPVESP